MSAPVVPAINGSKSHVAPQHIILSTHEEWVISSLLQPIIWVFLKVICNFLLRCCWSLSHSYYFVLTLLACHPIFRLFVHLSFLPFYFSLLLSSLFIGLVFIIIVAISQFFLVPILLIHFSVCINNSIIFMNSTVNNLFVFMNSIARIHNLFVLKHFTFSLYVSFLIFFFHFSFLCCLSLDYVIFLSTQGLGFF